MKKVLIIGSDSGIGNAIFDNFSDKEWRVFGTSRKPDPSQNVSTKQIFYNCELSSLKSLDAVFEEITQVCFGWDVLIFTPATLEPLGMFTKVAIDSWVESFNINFSHQVYFLHKLLTLGNTASKLEPIVIFFAGGGTNSATIGSSSYTIAKIAMIKLVEILDAELSNFRFCILGPGWVNTKIHNQTLSSVHATLESKNLTRVRLENNDFTSMNKITDFVEWAIMAPRKIVSGRNFSIVDDPIYNHDFIEALKGNHDFLKLRRKS